MNRTAQMVHRYAKTLHGAAGQEGGLDAVRSDLAEVRRWLGGAPAFRVFAACARLGDREARARAVRELARAAGLGRLTAEFLARVETTRGLEHLGEILDEFDRLDRERAGIVRAEIVSARPLTEAQRAELVRRFGRAAGGRRLEMAYKEDPEILGGFVARIGEQVHDYSVSGRLARLRRRLAEA